MLSSAASVEFCTAATVAEFAVLLNLVEPVPESCSCRFAADLCWWWWPPRRLLLLNCLEEGGEEEEDETWFPPKSSE